MSNKGQVWVETVLYTLIGLVLIGLVLAFSLPKINEIKDKSLVEQSIETLNIIDQKISSSLRTPGNVRNVPVVMKKGELIIDSDEDTIAMVLSELQGLYSEPGADISIGSTSLLTEEGQKDNIVTLTLNYSGVIDITFEGATTGSQKFSQSTIPYSFSITNFGDGGSGLNVVDIGEVS
jgi:type II secretory pathway pseudopilin PulG